MNPILELGRADQSRCAAVSALRSFVGALEESQRNLTLSPVSCRRRRENLRKVKARDDTVGNIGRRQLCRVDAEIIRPLIVNPARIELMSGVGKEEPFARRSKIPFGRLLGETKRRLVTPEPLRLRRFEFYEDNSTASVRNGAPYSSTVTAFDGSSKAHTNV
jgi:hypothetical protein